MDTAHLHALFWPAPRSSFTGPSHRTHVYFEHPSAAGIVRLFGLDLGLESCVGGSVCEYLLEFLPACMPGLLREFLA